MNNWNHQEVQQYLFEHYGLAKEKIDTHAVINLLAGLDQSKQDQQDIKKQILSSATIGETYFLRHVDQFKWITQKWLPQLVSKIGKQKYKLRVLCAACATGEEAYSTVAVLHSALPDGWQLETIALDVSEKSLQIARKGSYSLWSLRGVSLKENDHWLKVEGQKVQVAEHIKKEVQFINHNILESFSSFGSFDLIFCRNVMIYFHPEAIFQVWQNLSAGLKPDGIIIPGPSDPGIPQDIDLQLYWTSQIRIFCKKNSLFASNENSSQSKIVAKERPKITLNKKPTIPVKKIKKNVSKTIGPAVSGNQWQRILTLVQYCDYKAAMEMLDKQIEEDPLQVKCYLLKALIHKEQGDIVQALVNARQAVYLAPSASYPIFIMADLLEDNGKIKQAKARYQRVAEILTEMEEHALLEFSEGLTAGQLKDIIHARKTK